MSRKKNKGKKRRLSSGNRRFRERKIPLNKSSFDIGIELRKALRYHQSGQLHKAEEIHRKILEINLNHSDSLHLLGVIAHQAGKSDIAVSLINKAIQNNPKSPVCYYNIGCVFLDQGDSNEAISCYSEGPEINAGLCRSIYQHG